MSSRLSLGQGGEDLMAPDEDEEDHFNRSAQPVQRRACAALIVFLPFNESAGRDQSLGRSVST